MDEQNIQAQQVQNKNMKPCPSCGNMISKKAKACPACGAKIKKPVYKRAWFIVLMVIIAISVIAAVAGGGNDDTASNTSGTNDNSSQSSTSAQPEASTYKPGSTLLVSDVKMTYKSCEEWKNYNEFTQPKSGNKIIRAFFEFENTGKTDRSVGSFEFQCYADGAVADSYYFSSDNTLQSIVTLSGGRKTSGYVYFEVPKNAKNIEIEYETNFWTDKKAIFEVVI